MKSRSELCRVVLVDDHKLVREGLRQLLSADQSIEITGEANDGNELLALLQKTPCDICILDLSMPNLSGIEALQALEREFPDIKILVLTMHKDARYFRQVSSNGNVWGYIIKDDAYEQLKDAIRKILAGTKAYSPQIQQAIVEDYKNIQGSVALLEWLTRREREVLRLAARGLMNKEIANDLFISVRTVETHRANIMEKLHLKNLAELVRFAVDHGLE